MKRCKVTFGVQYIKLHCRYVVYYKKWENFTFIIKHHTKCFYFKGKPSRLTDDEIADPSFMVKKFREVCSWQSFTFNRNDTDWKYEVLISK